MRILTVSQDYKLECGVVAGHLVCGIAQVTTPCPMRFVQDTPSILQQKLDCHSVDGSPRCRPRCTLTAPPRARLRVEGRAPQLIGLSASRHTVGFEQFARLPAATSALLQ